MVLTSGGDIFQIADSRGTNSVSPDGTYPNMSVGNDGTGKNIADQFAVINSDIEGLREDVENEAHFRGYLATNAEILELKGTPNDYAYSAQSGTIWIYQNDTGWKNSGKEVPDQVSPASNDTPLMDGIASAGTSNEYARGDHRHPSDDTKVTVTDEFPASQVVLQSDITLAGDYVQVGNISKGSETASTVYQAKGKSVAQVIEEIFTKRLQPSIVKVPSVIGFTFDRTGNSVEVGTTISAITVGTLTLDNGAYTYDTDTGVKATGYSISRVVNGVATQISTEPSVEDTNDGNGFVIGDGTTITYKGEINYSQGNIATDNLGSPSDPPLRISAGTATSSTLSPLTGYRNYFYGTVSTTPSQGTAITSAMIRNLTKSNREYASGKFTLTVPAGATGVYIACISTRTGVTSVINKTALNADVTATFVKQTNISVEGANGYAGTAYNVWYYIPAVPYENVAELEVTLG